MCRPAPGTRPATRGPSRPAACRSPNTWATRCCSNLVRDRLTAAGRPGDHLGRVVPVHRRRPRGGLADRRRVRPDLRRLPDAVARSRRCAGRFSDPIARAIVVLGVIWMAFPLCMFPFAEQHVSSALAGMLNGAVPLFVAAVASALARRAPPRRSRRPCRRLSRRDPVALPGADRVRRPGRQLLGVLLILAALVSYGFALYAVGPLQQRNGALPVVWRALGVAVVLTAPLGVPAVAAGRWSLWPVASLIALGAGGTGDRLCHERSGGRTNGRDRRVGQQLHHSGRGARARRRPTARTGVVGSPLPAPRSACSAPG